MSTFETLRRALLELLFLLKSLSTNQVSTLTRLEHDPKDILSPAYDLQRIVESINDQEFEWIVGTALKSPDDLREYINQSQHGKSLNIDQILAFGCLFRLLLLQEMFQKLKIVHIEKLTEIIPRIPPDLQLKLLQQLQQVLYVISPEKLEQLWHDFQQECSNPQGQEFSLLMQELEGFQDRFMLYDPLRGLFTMQLKALIRFQDVFLRLYPVQFVQLVRLLQADPLKILEIRQLLLPDGWKGLQSLGAQNNPDGMDTEFVERLSIAILEQPPEQTVYKRNLKPYPVVMIQGDERAFLQPGESLVVAPVLYRYDNLEPVGKINGITPLPVTSGSSVAFKKIKVLVTSNQLNNTLFFLQFELRKVSGNKQHYETVAIAQSNPIFVVSHTTLMKKPASGTVQLATVSEIIPAKGTVDGGTKVAILGSNFVDTPLARVWFDNIEVKPEFHGPKTLTCITPRHQPGQASVSVSNGFPPTLPKPGESQAFFTFEDTRNFNEFQIASQTQSCDWDSAARAPQTLLTESGTFDFLASMEGIDELDFRGYSMLHYAAAQGDLTLAEKLIRLGANPNVLDKNGNSPLHWSVFHQREPMVSFLISRGAQINLQNFEGDTPLHWACSVVNNARLVWGLIQLGAWLNLTAEAGQTALHNACAVGDLQTIVCLLRAGAFINAEDEHSESALHWAVREEQTNVVKLLLQAGIQVNLQNDDGETALHLAVTTDYTAAVDLLLRSPKVPVDISAQDECGMSPVQLALVYAHVGVVQKFLECGVDIASYLNLKTSTVNLQQKAQFAYGDQKCALSSRVAEYLASVNQNSPMTDNSGSAFVRNFAMLSIPTV